MAFLDAADQWHVECTDAWRDVADKCVTTDAVVTEACHLIGRSRATSALALEFLLAAEIPILGLERPLHDYAAHLMNRYADLPMDFADASLVAIADALKIGIVFTTDRKGFRTYRRSRGAQFEIVPNRVPQAGSEMGIVL